jgi:asparagine synthase (glutamine-hydrolysing)
MIDAIRHRGRDGRAAWLAPDADVAVGHVHLNSFAAQTADGDPGLAASSDAVAAVDGPVFPASSADAQATPAELVLRAYLNEGSRFPAGLDGPRSLVVWDRKSMSLTLARDPLGEKPLYYHFNPATGLLVFASEIKCLLAHPAVSAELDVEGLAWYLSFGWMPAPKTMFRGIEKLRPGERLDWNAESGISRHAYWQLPPVTSDAGDLSACVSRARDLYLRALEKSVRGMDEVGVFLSGGMDSTILVIALRELGIPRIQTFTLGLPSDDAQQRDRDVPYARLVADEFGTIHHELNLRPPFDPTALMPRVIGQFDDPILTPNCYTKYVLAELAGRAGVNSVLTGSGAGGGCGPYRRFRDPHLRKKMLKKVRGLETDVDRFFRLRGKVLTPADQRELLGASAVLSRDDYARGLQPYFDQIHTDEFPRRYLLANLLLTIPEKAVVVMDRGGMLASVDVRAPHLDRDVIEFQMDVPSSFDGGETHVGIKCLLDEAFADRIPQPVLDREETGFPSYYWHDGELAGFQERFFTPEALQRAGMFRPQAVRRIVEEESRDTTSKSVGKRSWVLTQLCLWHALHIQQDADWLEAARNDLSHSVLDQAVHDAVPV